MADITYPEVYQRFLQAVDIINFDLTWMISTGCFVVVDFHSQLLILTLGPIMVMLFLGGTYTYVSHKHRASEEALTITRHKHVSMILLVLFLVYSSVSSVVFQTFDCEVLDDGKDYLRADYTIECDSVKHKAHMAYAGFMITLYPLGIPAFFAYLLFRNRNVLMDEANREKALNVRSISHLWKPYRPPRFYYEVVECCRRIVLTGVILIGNDDSAAMIAVTLALAFVFTVVSEGLAPYESQLDAWVSRLGHAVVVSTIYYALLLKVDVSDETDASQSAFGVVLIGVHVSMVLAVIGETALTTYSMNKGQVEDPLPRFQQYRSPRIQFATRTVSGVSHVVSSDSLRIKEVELREQKPAPLRRRSEKLRAL